MASFALGGALMIVSPAMSLVCLVSLGAYYVASARLDGKRQAGIRA